MQTAQTGIQDQEKDHIFTPQVVGSQCSKLIPVPIDIRWPGVWNQIEPYVAEALERGSSNIWDVNDVREILLARGAIAWGLIKDGKVIGAAVSSDRYYPKKKVMEILLVAMDHNNEESWVPAFEEFKEYAKLSGYDMLYGGGRPGWARKLGARPKYNFEIDL